MKILLITVMLCSAGYAQDVTMDDYYKAAKEKCHDLGCVREEINRINIEILKLLAERTAYVKRAGDLKGNKVARDEARIVQQEKFLVEQSEKLRLPIEISLPAFRAIVESSTQYEQCYMDSVILK